MNTYLATVKEPVLILFHDKNANSIYKDIFIVVSLSADASHATLSK